MDIILVILIIIIIILGFINIYKDSLVASLEGFQGTTTTGTTTSITSTTNIPSCTTLKNNKIEGYTLKGTACDFKFVKDKNIHTDSNITNYAISLVFKPNNTVDNQCILNYKDKWMVYILNNRLYLTDSNYDSNDPNYDSNDSNSNLKWSDKIVWGNLYKPNKTPNTINTLGNSLTHYHLAINVKKNHVFLFLNGEEGFITVDDDDDNDNDKTFKTIKDNLQLGHKNDTDYFKGNILDLRFFNENKSEEELCGMWGSCDLCDFTFDDSITSVNDCITKCSNTCPESECANKCSDWKPKCEFEPVGNTLNICMNECNNDETNSCEYDECYKKCNNCTDPITCPWYKQTDLPTQSIESLKCKMIRPPQLEFRVISGNKLEIIWHHPLKTKDTKQLDDKINMFILVIKKTNDRTEGQRIITKEVDDDYINNIKSFNDNDKSTLTYNTKKWYPVHSYILDNLDDDEYTISCKSVIRGGGDCNPSTTPNTTDSDSEPRHTISDSSFHYNIVLSQLKSKFLNDRA
jgi:hypothetical protein